MRRFPRAPRRVHGMSLRTRRSLSAYTFVAPSVIVLAVFMVWPMIWSLRTSLYDSSQFAPPTFVGLGNYRQILHDPAFRGDLVNTLVYAVVVPPVTVGLALGAALMLHRRLRGRSFFRAAIFLPAVLSLGVMGIAWGFLLDPTIGLVPHWL